MRRQRTMKLSYRSRIFLFLILLALIPPITISAITAYRSVSQVLRENNSLLETTLEQNSSSMDRTLSDSAKITDLPLLNNDLLIDMNKNFGEDYIGYARANKAFGDALKQAYRINSNLMTCIFVNRYGYRFEYNNRGQQYSEEIEQKIPAWEAEAEVSPHNTLYAGIQEGIYANRKLLYIPIIKIVTDSDTYSNIGTCYLEVNFENTLSSLIANDTETSCYILSENNSCIYSKEKADSFLLSLDDSRLTDFIASLPVDGTAASISLKSGARTFIVTGCTNNTTGWHILQIYDITDSIRNTTISVLENYAGIMFFSLLLGLFLSWLLAYQISKPITKISAALDAMEGNEHTPIDPAICGNVTELQRLVDSFNAQSRRLSDSIRRNYEIRLEEQNVRYQMLQFQINHHFLYNTLNVIHSLSVLHDVPEIGTIAIDLSELLRYGLQKSSITTVGNEIGQLRRYMEIQELRSPGKFSFNCSIPGFLQEISVPVFTFQPLAENAIVHGFSSKESGCELSVSALQECDFIHFYVADNGSGIEEEIINSLNSGNTVESSEKPNVPQSSGSHHSIGIQNIKQRLKSYYGYTADVIFESSPGEGTIADIRIPRKKD